MADIGGNLEISLNALKRRKIFRVAAAYAIGAWVLLQLAEVHCREGDYARYEQRIDAAEKLAPADEEVFRLRLRCLAAQENFDDILKILDPYRNKRPDDLTSIYFAGRLLGNSPKTNDKWSAMQVIQDVVDAQQSPTGVGDP